MSKTIFTVILALFATCTFAAEPLKTEEQRTLYAVGLAVAKSLTVFDLTPSDLEFVRQGLVDGATGRKPEVELAAYNEKIQILAKARRKALGEKLAGAGKEYLEKAALEKGAVKTPSGMVFTSLVEGKGISPAGDAIVTVNYRGSLVDGREFDSSARHGKPLEFKLGDVISCWIEGLQMMKPGGKARFVCPPNLAYGDTGAGEMVLPGATLVFDLELLAVKPADAPLPPPASPSKN
jgi:FKBP-type peptidyl-prolyl cis-trans isomerase FkpA